MVSWVSLFAPGPGTAIKDMDVVGDHCVLTVRTPADELVLTVVPLTHPKKAYTVQVSVSENSWNSYFFILMLLLFCSYVFYYYVLLFCIHLLYSYISTHITKLPPWACAIETKKPGLAEQREVLEFLISSPVHPPVPHCLYPEDGLLLSEDGSSLENQGNYTTTRLKACSQVRTLDI